MSLAFSDAVTMRIFFASLLLLLVWRPACGNKSLEEKKTSIEQATLTLAKTLATTGVSDKTILSQQLVEQLQTKPLVFGSAFCYNPQDNNTCPFAYRDADGNIDVLDIADFIDYTEPEYYAAAAPTDIKKQGRTIWTDPYVDVGGAGQDICMITFSVPLFRESEFLGVLTGDLLISQVGAAETCVLTDLLEDYDPRSAPADVVHVSSGLFDVAITSFRPFESKFEAVLGVRLSWVDSRLAWRAMVYNGTIEIDRQDIWYPRLVHFKNQFDEERLYESPAIISPDGRLQLEDNIQITFFCQTEKNLKRFPFDRHHCSMDLGATGQRIVMDHKYGFEIKAHDPNFELSQSIEREAGARGDFIYFKMFLERHPFTAWVRLILPAILINLVGFMAFWIKNLEESIVLSVTALLCTLAFRDTVEMPNTSNLTWSELLVMINILYQVLVMLVVLVSYSATGARINAMLTRRLGRRGPWNKVEKKNKNKRDSFFGFLRGVNEFGRQLPTSDNDPESPIHPETKSVGASDQELRHRKRVRDEKEEDEVVSDDGGVAFSRRIDWTGPSRAKEEDEIITDGGGVAFSRKLDWYGRYIVFPSYVVIMTAMIFWRPSDEQT